MNKKIQLIPNKLLMTSIMLGIFAFTLGVYTFVISRENEDLSQSLNEQYKNIELINSAEDIQKVKNLAMLLVSAEQSRNSSVKTIIKSTANMSIVILVFSIFIGYNAYLLKIFLTSKSTPTKNP